MKFTISLPLLLLALLLSTGCASIRQTSQLKKHRANIRAIAYNSNLSAEHKIDELAMDVIKMMDQALSYLDPRKGAEFLEKYSAENEEDIEVIMEEFSQWQESLGTMEQIAFGLRLVQKPYVSDLARLSKEVERKYKQFKFAYKLASRLKIL